MKDLSPIAYYAGLYVTSFVKGCTSRQRKTTSWHHVKFDVSRNGTFFARMPFILWCKHMIIILQILMRHFYIIIDYLRIMRRSNYASLAAAVEISSLRKITQHRVSSLAGDAMGNPNVLSSIQYCLDHFITFNSYNHGNPSTNILHKLW